MLLQQWQQESQIIKHQWRHRVHLPTFSICLRLLVMTVRILPLLRMRHASMSITDPRHTACVLPIPTRAGLHTVLMTSIHMLVMVIPRCRIHSIPVIHTWSVVVDPVPSWGAAASAVVEALKLSLPFSPSLFQLHRGLDPPIGFVAHIETCTSGPTCRKRLHNVGIRIMFKFRPLDVSIAIFKVAESTRAKFEVEEDECSQHQNTTSHRNTNDETGRCST